MTVKGYQNHVYLVQHSQFGKTLNTIKTSFKTMSFSEVTTFYTYPEQTRPTI